MKFVKGILIGGVVGAGIAMMYNDNMHINRKKVMKRGRQLVKRMGVM